MTHSTRISKSSPCIAHGYASELTTLDRRRPHPLRVKRSALPGSGCAPQLRLHEDIVQCRYRCALACLCASQLRKLHQGEGLPQEAGLEAPHHEEAVKERGRRQNSWSDTV